MGRLGQAVEALNNALNQRPSLKPAREALHKIQSIAHRAVRDQIAQLPILAEDALPEDTEIEDEDLDIADFEEQGEATVTSDFDGLSPNARPPATAASSPLKHAPPLKSLNGEVVVVSGLPRSGTSMMLQMLDAGGLPILSDNLRVADADNPKGYYELEAVKATKEDPSWLTEARGRGVKVIYALLEDLPDDYSYKVIFMRRKLEEVTDSQSVMLDRSGRTGGELDNTQMGDVFRRQLGRIDTWLEARENFEILNIDYNETVEKPRAAAAEIDGFLGNVLDVETMAEVVDDTLYRQRR
jgi:hypothetical protein